MIFYIPSNNVIPAKAGIQGTELLSLDSRFRGNDIDNKGYTLIELLLALLIFSIVAVLISNSLSNLLDSRERNETYEARLIEIQTAISLLERDVGQMINRPIQNALGQVDPALVMDSQLSEQRIEFTRTGNINPLSIYPRSTLTRVAYQFKSGNLLRFTWPTLDRNSDITPQERILLTNIEKVEWKFFDADKKAYTLWPPTAAWLYKIPHAIQLTLVLKDKGQLSRFFLLPENEDVVISK